MKCMACSWWAEPKCELTNIIKLFADWQGFWQADVWEADVGDERTDIELVTGLEGWEESSAAGADAKCLCREVCNLKKKYLRLKLFIVRSRGHIGTNDKFRTLSNTFTQRFQKKAPFFSWCWEPVARMKCDNYSIWNILTLVISEKSGEWIFI